MPKPTNLTREQIKQLALGADKNDAKIKELDDKRLLKIADQTTKNAAIQAKIAELGTIEAQIRSEIQKLSIELEHAKGNELFLEDEIVTRHFEIEDAKPKPKN